MSYSSLWAVDKETYGECIGDYKNSWLFSPTVWEILAKKCLGIEHGAADVVIGAHNTWNKINRIMNESENMTDRIIWEMSNQQMFATKDKDIIATALKSFLLDNKQWVNNFDKSEHLFGRFGTMADDVSDLDPEEYPYFIFKNSSCDDSVEKYFGTSDDPIKLNSYKNHVVEFVKIENGKIVDFISNTKLFE